MRKEGKRGLVLEGGAMRGLFTAGVLDTLMEHSLYPDGLIGVSAGAAFGCNLKSRQKGRVLRYNKRFCKDPRYCSLRSLLFTGDLFGADFCYKRLPDELDVFDKDTFNSTPMDFYMVCTDTQSGGSVYKKCNIADEKCYDWMRASASMPLVSRPVSIDGNTYLDGAISDAIPLRFFQQQGYTKNIVVLTQSASYRKKPQKGMPFIRFFLHKYPAIIRQLQKRHISYNDTLEYVEKQAEEGRVLLIRPEKDLPIKRICRDPELLQIVYDEGKAAAEKCLPALKEFLRK
ncbi:MAG: patatin family protein [Lentisphaeria bacterium]|nr:patatin family protein [Lentisphaeria bacterium]